MGSYSNQNHPEESKGNRTGNYFALRIYSLSLTSCLSVLTSLGDPAVEVKGGVGKKKASGRRVGGSAEGQERKEVIKGMRGSLRRER